MATFSSFGGVHHMSHSSRRTFHHTRPAINVFSKRDSERNLQDGFTFAELVIVLLIFSLTLALSFPTLRNFLQLTRNHLKLREEELELTHVALNLQYRLHATQLVPLGDTLQIVTGSPSWNNELEHLLQTRLPHPESAIILGVEPFISRPYPLQMEKTATAENELTICGQFPDSIALGISGSSWKLLRIKHNTQLSAPCGTSSKLLVTAMGDAPASAAPILLFPLRQAELFYRDRLDTLRRYRLAERRTEPLLKGVTRFNARIHEGQIEIELTLTKRSEHFSIPLNESVLPQLAL